MFDESADVARVRGDINLLFTAFAQEVEKAVVTIVDELAVPIGSRTIRAFVGASGSIVLGTYFSNSVMYRMNVDSVGGAYGGDKNAMKVASQALRANGFLSTVAPLHFLHQPLIMVMTFRGFRVTATTVPPLRADGLLAGSLDGGKAGHFAQPTGFLATIIEDCWEQLGLCPHQVRSSAASSGAGGGAARGASSAASIASSSAGAVVVNTPLPMDAAIIAGWDQRLYVMNIGRLLPPVAPLRGHAQYVAATSGLFWRMRPELLTRTDYRLSSDAFVPNASQVEDNEDVLNATVLLRDELVPSVAAVLGFLEPTVAPTEALDKCASCGKPSEDHVVFAVCAADCCKICPQCCLDIAKTAFWDGQVEDAEAKVKAIITCKSYPRTLKGFVMTPDLTTIMHAHGVNLRYLNHVYQKIPRSAFHCTAHYVEIEMITRTAKHLLSEILRKAPDNDAANASAANFFVALLQPSGQQAERFWSETLGPAIQQQFDVTAPFDTDSLDRDLVYRRLSELTGVQFSAASVRSLLTDKPFVQMLPPHPVLKTVHLPHLVSAAGERREYLDKYSGLLQVYWSGLPETPAEAQAWAEKRPVHLRSI